MLLRSAYRHFGFMVFLFIVGAIFIMGTSCAPRRAVYTMPDGTACRNRGGTNTEIFSRCDNGRVYVNPESFAVTTE